MTVAGIGDRKESAIQVAKREIAAEQQEKDVKRLKGLITVVRKINEEDERN
jgi:hypothetical protein